MNPHQRLLSTLSSTAALNDDGDSIPSSPRYKDPVSSSSRRPWSAILMPYRVILRILTACLALATVGLLAYLMVVRSSTKDSRYLDDGGQNVMAWPSTVAMQPTILLLCVAGWSFLGDSVSLVLSCAEAQRTGLATVWIGSLSFIACIAAWIVGLVFAKIWNHVDASSSDLWSWSCAHKNIDLNYGNASFSFGKMCLYMNFSFGGGLATGALQLVNFILFCVVYKSKLGQKKLAKRNEYVRKYILGTVDGEGAD